MKLLTVPRKSAGVQYTEGCPIGPISEDDPQVVLVSFDPETTKARRWQRPTSIGHIRTKKVRQATPDRGMEIVQQKNEGATQPGD